MNGAEILLDCLKREGVEVIFGISGGAVLPIYDALNTQDHIWSILTRHEQGAAHMAEGYAKATGRIGVCLGTSGPGATNLVTGICDAMMDSVPILALTGQVPTPMIGKDAFQECDIFGITLPIVKHSRLVKNVRDLPGFVKELMYVCRTGRPGPVLLDVPRDVAQATCNDWEYPETFNLRGYNPCFPVDLSGLAAAARLMAEAERPLLYVGGGACHAEATEELVALAERLDAPCTTTLMGKGAFPDGHPLSVGAPGMHGTAYANWAMHQSDLLIALGVRFDDRVTGKLSEFAPNAKVIHVDIDPAELGKNRRPDVGLVCDVKTAVRELLKLVEPKCHKDWNALIAQWKREQPLRYSQANGHVRAQHALQVIAEVTGGDAIVTTDVGQHQMWAMQYYPCSRPRQFITSGGLGTMGFGFPAAIGAKVGCPDAEVWCISGDGSFQMNLQELATSMYYGIPVKIAIMNNASLGMVRQWQKMFYGKRYGGIDLAECPNFVKLAEAYGAVGIKVEQAGEVEGAVKLAHETNDRTVVIDFRCDPEEDVYPMIPSGTTVHDMRLQPD